MVSESPYYFLDSNIVIYAIASNQNIDKQRISRQLLDSEKAVLSTQVVNEVCINLVRKSDFQEPRINTLIKTFYKRFRVISFDVNVISEASNLRSRYLLSFWDSLVVSSALTAGVPILYSEDMQNGLFIQKKLKIVNPFV